MERKRSLLLVPYTINVYISFASKTGVTKSLSNAHKAPVTALHWHPSLNSFEGTFEITGDISFIYNKIFYKKLFRSCFIEFF
jgi:hypothetical protein